MKKVIWSLSIVTGLLVVVGVGVAAAKPLTQVGVPAELTPGLLALVLSGGLSILATIVPGFRVWFAAKTEEAKQSMMAIATAAIAIVLYILACTPSLGFMYVACPAGGVWGLLGVIMLAWTTNQGVDRIIPKPSDVKAAKAARPSSNIPQ